MGAALSLGEAVRSRLAFLADDHGLEVVREDEHLVRLESRSLGVEVMFDPRGEVEVRVFRPGHEHPLECWTWRG